MMQYAGTATFAWIGALLVIGTVVQVGKRIALGSGDMPQEGYRGWRGIYFVTLRLHPIVLGLLFGLLISGMPTYDQWPSWFFYMTSGAGSMVAYDTVINTAKAHIRNSTRVRLSQRPPPSA